MEKHGKSFKPFVRFKTFFTYKNLRINCFAGQIPLNGKVICLVKKSKEVHIISKNKEAGYTKIKKGMAIKMIDKENFHHFNYIKKEELSGSMEGMRYMMRKIKVGEEDKLQVTIWPGPLNYIKTPEEKKKVIELPFSPEGVELAADWLNEQYETGKTEWEKGKRLI